MQIKLRGKQVSIEKLKKQGKKGDNFLTMPEAEEYSGIIRHVGPDAEKDLQVGQRVYFANIFQIVRMGGAELCVMEDKNVLAVVQDEVKEQTQES